MDAQFTNNLAVARTNAGMTQQEVANAIGCTVQAYQNYEYGKRDIRGTILVDLARVLGCTVNFLLGLSGTTNPLPVSSSAPSVGSIAAGTPREAIQLDGERMWCPPSLVERYPNAFFLKVSGDSMDRVFPDGCWVLIDPDQTEVVSGKRYAVLVNGFDATLKTCYVAGRAVVLHPESTNPVHKDRLIDPDDPDAPYFRVVGRAVWFQAEVSW